MIDRFGRTVRVAWSAHEMLWVEAANSLPPASRYPALQDVAAMTGRGYQAVLRKAKDMRQAALDKAYSERRKADRAIVLVPVSSFPAPVSSLPAPSKAALMAGRSIGRLPAREVAA